MAVGVGVRSIAVMRAQARAPRIAVTACASLLSVVGVKSLLTPPPSAPRPAVVEVARPDLAGSWAAERAARELVGGTDSRVVADEPNGPGRSLVTVAVTQPRPFEVAVLVGRDGRGGAVVYGPPAIVGPSPVRTVAAADTGVEVSDGALVTVVSRVLANYLRGQADNVAADLAPGVHVAVPSARIVPRPIDALTWLVPGRRVAVALSARLPSGALVELRYELGVARVGGRWVITAFENQSTHLEVRP